MSFGRTVHSTISVRSRCDSVFDQMPIFITRLVEESGCRITGGRATTGSRRDFGRDALLHHLPHAERIGAVVEDQHDLREPEHRLRAHRLDVRDAVERVLDRHRDERFDFEVESPGASV